MKEVETCVKEITAWEASDGRYFRNQAEAEKHEKDLARSERILEIRAALSQITRPGRSNVTFDAAGFLADHFDASLAILNQLAAKREAVVP